MHRGRDAVKSTSTPAARPACRALFSLPFNARARVRPELHAFCSDGGGGRRVRRGRLLAGRLVDEAGDRNHVAAIFRVARAASAGAELCVMLLVAGIAIFVSLPIAIGIGVLVAILMFIRSKHQTAGSADCACRSPHVAQSAPGS